MKSLFPIFMASLLSGCIAACTHSKTSTYSVAEDGLAPGCNLQAAERTLLEYGPLAGSHLLHFLKNNPASISYPFTLLQDSSEISIHTSADGRLRFYSYDTHLGGTCVDWVTLIQYTNGTDTVAGEFRPYNDSGIVFDTNTLEEEEVYFDPCIINGLLQFSCSDGETLYVAECYMRECSSVGATELVALKFKDGKIEKTPGFRSHTGEYSDVGYEHEIPGWYFRTLGEGWEWLNSLDSATQTIYVPLIDGMDITDQYLLYRFDGTQLDYKGSGGGFWLHPSVRNFKRLIQLYDTDALRFRLDEMPDGKTRYCAWNAGLPMSEKPSVIIIGGDRDVRPGSIRFRNKGFEYYTPDPESDNPSKALTVEKRGKVLASHEIRDF